MTNSVPDTKHNTYASMTTLITNNTAHHSLADQLPQSKVQAPPLEIDLWWRPEPEHILLTHGHRLDIDQMLRTNVSRHTGAAPRTAAQGQRGIQVEVVQVTNRSAGVTEERNESENSTAQHSS